MSSVLPLYERLIATLPDVDRKGAKIPYTSLNGHMFSQLTNEGEVALRLPLDQVPGFLAKHKTKNHVAYDAVRNVILGLVFGEKARHLVQRESQCDLSFVGELAEHVPIQRRVRDLGALPVDIRESGDQALVEGEHAAHADFLFD